MLDYSWSVNSLQRSDVYRNIFLVKLQKGGGGWAFEGRSEERSSKHDGTGDIKHLPTWQHNFPKQLEKKRKKRYYLSTLITHSMEQKNSNASGGNRTPGSSNSVIGNCR